MEAWYDDLIRHEDRAVHCFTSDYGPFADRLRTFGGTVLDLGGGCGVTRHWLPHGVRYVVLDPSTDWLTLPWATLAHRFPCLAAPPAFVRGVGEHLPFRDGVFDTVLAFWSLNHVADPTRVFAEVRRVLRPGGRFLAILEDVDPRWADLLRPALRAALRPLGPDRTAGAKLRRALTGRPAPLQPDHLRLTERDLRAWASDGFDVVRRDWVRHYLTYEFRTRPARP